MNTFTKKIGRAAALAVPLTLFSHLALVLFFTLAFTITALINPDTSDVKSVLFGYWFIHFLLVTLGFAHFVALPYTFITLHIFVSMMTVSLGRFIFHLSCFVIGIGAGTLLALVLNLGDGFKKSFQNDSTPPLVLICGSVGFVNALAISTIYELKRVRKTIDPQYNNQKTANVKGCSGGEARALRLHPWLNKPGL